jgi:acetyl-CoA carboxylase biotin carboxyl carrier protein
VDIKEIRTLIDLMKKNGLAVFKMEREDFKITLKTAEAGQILAYQHPSSAAPAAPLAPEATAAASVVASDLKEIKSPMVGTFYSAPSPESDPFLTVGQTIGADSVVCIIEAMKVMNEIKAELGGTVVEILAENGKPVQFGQVLFRVK